MYILAGEKTLTITSYSPVRDRVTGKVNLELKTSRGNTTSAELEELSDYIEANAPAIEVYDDNGDKVTRLEGFKFYPSFALNRKTNTWEVTIENESENTFQIGRAHEKITALEQANADLEQTVQEQAVTIANQGQTIQGQAITIYNQGQAILDQNIVIDNQNNRITEQNNTIDNQNKRITEQEETITQQAAELGLLNDTLLEMLMG